MEENSLTPKQNKLRGLAFLKIGLVEFGFVVVVLALLFGILNYFNILSISTVFPKQLSWLPKKEVSTGTSPTNFTPAQQKAPTGAFQYDTKKAEALLTKYIESTIKSELLSSKINIQQGLTIDGRTENVKYEFGSLITASDATISVNFHYKENSNTPNDYSIFVQPKNITQSIATVSLANSLLPHYFSSPYSILTCQTKGAVSYCETFKDMLSNKSGYGILIGNNSGTPFEIIFTCLIPKESKNYESFSSCLTQ